MANKTWFITGSSRGLGREIALAALKKGDSVVATAREPSSLGDLLSHYGKKVLPIKLDVSNNNEVRAAVEEAFKYFGQIDVLVNNAGYANLASIEDISISDFQDQVATNFFGVVYTMKAVLPFMRDQQRGSIINISSIGGRFGNAGLSAYQSSKFAVNGFTEVLAQEVSSFGIKVTTLEPGGIATDWAGSSMNIPPISEPYQPIIGGTAKLLRNINSAAPEERIGRLSDPAKVAGVVIQLAEMPEPPLHLLMGSSAFKIAQEGAKKLAESDKRFEELTKSTDYTD
ncbi:SDR family NAD(P)-dependent oxidoreductase [Paenibacillus sp. R14(2021)]|uniref:SDR family NAD(P)-dependent oxidoreductase n=1 Tax=Paenibacillus sp. R14(2021) TaxID=2859228 RepID=UPI001C614B72|nr:SDR family NAD(P)-dependent oxidoreductase [Paenibacillus sp. R14(2021)]